MRTTFEDFLQEKHAEEYLGLDDNMPDAFDDWLGELQADDFIALAEAWGETIKPSLSASSQEEK